MILVMVVVVETFGVKLGLLVVGGWLQKLPKERTTSAKSEVHMRSGHQ